MNDINPIEALNEAFSSLQEGNGELREELDRVKTQYDMLTYEMQGWTKLFGPNPYAEDSGISLETLKDVSRKLREEIAGSALPKRANSLLYSYTFGKSFIIPGINDKLEEPDTSKKGRKPDLERFYSDPNNQRYAFGEEAQIAMNSASSTDGMYLFLGDDSKKSGRAIPLAEIEAVHTNPDFSDDVWAYLRNWKSQENGKDVTKRAWYYTDRFTGVRKATIKDPNGKGVTVDKTQTIIDFIANGQTGWALGIPDLMAGQIWNEKYITMIGHGEEVSRTLAYYSAKVRTKSKTGASNVGLKLAGAGSGSGKTVAYGEGNDVDVFSSAGKVYNFGDLKVFAAMYAAAAGVPLTDLTADAGSAGAAYGAAAALLPSARRSIEARRNLWAAWYTRLLKWGTGKNVSVTPESIEETDPYRQAQIKALVWNSGLAHPDEARPELLEVAGMTPRHDKAPDGVLLPNNEKSWQRGDIDPKDGPATTTGSPDQGQSNGSGGTPNDAKNDLRTDGVSEMLKRMANDEFLGELRSLVERMEMAVSS